MQKILIVDDEHSVLLALRRELNEFYEIEAFGDPAVALSQCLLTQFDLVIADYRMPYMDGLEFLKQFGKLQPDAPRLLLSGKADINALIRTINEIHVYRYIPKPWDKDELLSNIRHALSYRDAIMERRLQIASNLNEQPSINDALCDNPYRIVLVNGDDYLLRLISSGLMDENGCESLYSAIRREIKQESSAKKFKSVIETVHTAKSAFTLVENNPCDLVIAGQVLPDMDGIEFLTRIRQVIPDAARILISDAPDKSILTQAINEAEVLGLLQLQCVNYELGADARRQSWNLHQIKTVAIQALVFRELLLGKTRSAPKNQALLRGTGSDADPIPDLKCTPTN